jgi:predicted RNA binding protein YcfA (HicA-like mRNA interferase family)
MKRRKLLRHLKDNNCELLFEGTNHSVYYNTTNNKTSTVPRHAEIAKGLVVKICKDLEIHAPKNF